MSYLLSYDEAMGFIQIYVTLHNVCFNIFTICPSFVLIKRVMGIKNMNIYIFLKIFYLK